MNANRAYYALLPLLNGQTVLSVEKIKNLYDVHKASGIIRNRILDTE